MRIRTLKAATLLGCSVLFTTLSAQDSGTFSTLDNIGDRTSVSGYQQGNRMNHHTKVETTSTHCGNIGDGTATIEIRSETAVAPFEFVLSPGNKSQVSYNGTTFFSALAVGDYTVTATDADGNVMDPASFTITNSGILDINFMAVNTSCEGSSNGRISIDPPAGTTPITYSLNGGSYTPENIFSNLATGTYLISARDAAGCEANSIPVRIDPGPSISAATISTATSCPGLNNGSIAITSSSGTAPFNYSLNGGNYQDKPVFSGLAPGTYAISIQDAIGCLVTARQTVVRGNVAVTGTVSIASNGIKAENVIVTPTAGSGPFEFSINNGNDWQSSNIFKNISPGSYSVLIREAQVCVSNKIPVVVPSAAPGFYVANAFTPDNDGRNDLFLPVPVGVKQLNYFRVFNRGGQLIYSTSVLNKGWDGKMTGKDQVAGTYVWMLQGITEKGVTVNEQGTVMLIR